MAVIEHFSQLGLDDPSGEPVGDFASGQREFDRVGEAGSCALGRKTVTMTPRAERAGDLFVDEQPVALEGGVSVRNWGALDAPETVMVIGADTADVPTPLLAATLKVKVPS